MSKRRTRRTIIVDGVEYMYTVNGSVLKVKNIGHITVAEAGSRQELQCECCGVPMHELYGDKPENYGWSVKPSDVARFIRERVKK